MYRDYKWKFALIGVLCLFALWASAVKTPDLGLDLKGGTRLVFSIPGATGPVIEDVIEGLQRRIDIQGNKEVKIYPSGETRIVVQIPTVSPAEEKRIRNILSTSGKLQFKILIDSAQMLAEEREIERLLLAKQNGTYVEDEEIYDLAYNPNADEALREIERATGEPQPGRRLVSGAGGEYDKYMWLLLLNGQEEERVNGTHLDRARPSVSLEGQNIVSFTTTNEGSRRMGLLTRANEGKPMAIVLDGDAISAPTIQSTITTHGQITGQFTPEEVRELVVVLKSGSLVAKPVPEFEDKVGALLGQQAQESGRNAMILALLIVIVFMVAYYRGAGIVADVGLAVNLLLLWGAMVIFNFTLTLPGFAGILLTVGMSVDANILIFERIREELRRGLSLRQAIEAGYDRAFWTIFDANITTLLTGAILYVIGTGPIKGFAVTLSLGIITSMFTAIVGTRMIFGWLVGTEKLTELTFVELVPSDAKFDFMGKKKVAAVLSLVLILGGFAVFSARGDEKLGIDFTGGTELRVNFRRAIDKQVLADELAAVEHDGVRPFDGIEIQNIGSDTAGTSQFLLRSRLPSIGETVALNLLQTELENAFRNDLAPNGWGHPETGEFFKVERRTPDSEAGSVIVYGTLEITETVDANGNPISDSLRVAMVEARIRSQQNLTATVALDPIEGAPRFRHAVITVIEDQLTAADAERITAEVQEAVDGFKRSEGFIVSSAFPLVSNIGPAVANVLRNKAILAILASLIGIILYITFRFEFRFAIASIFALVHDVLITLGFIAFGDMVGLDLKINLPIIAAFLTIIGYSLNDTIVVFDRIRENSQKRKKGEPFLDVVNGAINQTLSRTLLTSVTTFLAVAILWALSGVGVIEGLSLALMCGVVVGTYSSIFVASTVLTTDRKTVQTIALVTFAALIAIGLFFSYTNQGWLHELMQGGAPAAGG